MKNLIEQLKLSPKWSEFEKWWFTKYKDVIFTLQYPDIHLNFYYWCNFSFTMQEGVFKEFIEFNSKSIISFTENYWNLYLTEEDDFLWNMDFETFEELIIWYFSN